jgi:hypothetical protein
MLEILKYLTVNYISQQVPQVILVLLEFINLQMVYLQVVLHNPIQQLQHIPLPLELVVLMDFH